MPTFHPPRKPNPIPGPIACEKCGGRATLIRRRPDAYSRGKLETRTYECVLCRHLTERTMAVDDEPPKTPA